jgi:hypothetical protein
MTTSQRIWKLTGHKSAEIHCGRGALRDALYIGPIYVVKSHCLLVLDTNDMLLVPMLR